MARLIKCAILATFPFAVDGVNIQTLEQGDDFEFPEADVRGLAEAGMIQPPKGFKFTPPAAADWSQVTPDTSVEEQAQELLRDALLSFGEHIGLELEAEIALDALREAISERLLELGQAGENADALKAQAEELVAAKAELEAGQAKLAADQEAFAAAQAAATEATKEPAPKKKS